MNIKSRKIILNSIFIVIIALLIWPTSRSYFQQGLMKIGLFKPKLESKAEPKDATERTTQNPEPTPDVAFLDMEGNRVAVSELKNKVVFINFWATWCPPCRAEMPSINVLYDKFKANPNIAFLLVEIEGDKDKARDFLKNEHLDLPVFFPTGDIPSQWLGQSIPTTVILDKEGNLVSRHEGMADYSSSDVARFIDDLIKR